MSANRQDRASASPSEGNADPLPTQPTGRPRWARWAGEASGAFSDLGTFLPLMLGVYTVSRLDPTGMLIGFGLSALAVALIYRRPVPVQPMKVVAALAAAGSLGGTELVATGMLLGLALIALAATGSVRKLARLIPGPALLGVQLGVGLYLAWAGFGLAIDDAVLGGLALVVLLILQATPIKPLAPLLIIAGAAVVGVDRLGDALPSLETGLWFPHLALTDWNSILAASRSVLVPQLALTVTNAVLVTAAIAAEYFPSDRERISPERLSLTTGVLNLALAPMGAFPMCHGAGGLVVQHRFGARTGLAPALFGIACLGVGVLFGPGVLTMMSVLPVAAVGALLVVAGVDLALSRRLRHQPTDELVVVIVTGVVCLLANVAVGLAAGLVAEYLRRTLGQRLRP